MSIWLGGSKRKPSGGKYHKAETKRKRTLGSLPTKPTVSTVINIDRVRTQGGNRKNRLLSGNKINVYNPKQKKTVPGIIESVLINPSNRNYVRMNVVTKGAIVKTNLGEVLVTNRPGKEGLINGVLTELKKVEAAKKQKKAKVKKAKVHVSTRNKPEKAKKKGLKEIAKSVGKAVTDAVKPKSA